MTMWRLGELRRNGLCPKHCRVNPWSPQKRKPVFEAARASAGRGAGRSRSDLLPGLACARWGEGLYDRRERAHPVALSPMETRIGGLAG